MKIRSIAVAVTAAVVVGCTSRVSQAARKPNIIVIMADDLGYECMGANGGTSYKTPVFDRLSAEGMRFEHCYAQPLCTPSRVKIMTGMSNVRNYVRFGLLDTNQTTFAHLFKKAGYKTCVAGKWQLGRGPQLPQHFGFDRSCLWQHTRGRAREKGLDTRFESPALEVNGKPKDYPGKYGPDIVSDFICDFMETHKDGPFLVYYPMILTHCPFVPTPDSKDWDPESKGSPSYKGDPKYFGDMVTYMDKMVGKVADKAKQLGVAENTLILFTGDNGTDAPVVSMMGEKRVPGGKGKGSDNGTRVPLLAYWPGVIPAGKVYNNIVDLSDFLPTICEAAGVPVPGAQAIDGVSFLPQLRGEAGKPREWIYMWYNRSGGAKAQVEFARNPAYKLRRDGTFLDMTDDYNPRKRDTGGLTAEEQEAHRLLQGALEEYKDARPKKIAGAKKE